jgi:D-amino peptidase
MSNVEWRHWVLAVAGLLLLATAGARPEAGVQETKVFLSVDMEGIAGVVQPAQLGPTGFEYTRAREWMTGEARAAVDGASDAGANAFVVADSHGNAQNLLLEQFPDSARIVRGFPRPLSMMQGIDDTFTAAIFIGYHASEMTPGAVRGHTFSSVRLLGVSLNGVEVSEGVFNAAIAGHFGVPVVFVSGDSKAVAQLQAAVPGVDGVAVKEPHGYHSATTLTPARARAMIREGVRAAMTKRTAKKPYRVSSPIALEVGFKLTIDAERASYVPGLERSGAHTVRGTFNDMLQIVRLIQVLTSLEPPS